MSTGLYFEGNVVSEYKETDIERRRTEVDSEPGQIMQVGKLGRTDLGSQRLQTIVSICFNVPVT